MQKIVGLWRNMSKPEALTLAVKIEDWFQARGWKVLTEWEDIIKHKIEFLISLGGDGTLLQAAREASIYGIPVMGVNFGKLGFLCEIEREEVYSALEKLLRQEYQIQERLMFNVVINGGGQDGASYRVLNDVVFSREGSDGIITLQANLSGEPSVSYPADGLIISTPTGSTAYSLSAGGPIVSPNVQAILLTPLAAHSLSARPMLVSDEEEIKILLANGEKCVVTFDGRQSTLIYADQAVVIKTAPTKALLIRIGTRSFPQVVREKLRDRWHE